MKANYDALVTWNTESKIQEKRETTTKQETTAS